MTSKIILILAACVSFASCSNLPEKESEQTATEIATEEHEHTTSESIELNNGEKWVVDENMMAHIRKMEKSVLVVDESDTKDYKQLVADLQSGIDLLTSNCTMEGQAHDELHKWLLPYIDLVDAFSKTKDEPEQAKQFKKIKTSFSAFNQYFQ